MAVNSFVVLAPPALIETEQGGALQESVSTLGPGKPEPTPSRLAQPTLTATTLETPPSAAPGLSETRTQALAKTLLLKANDALLAKDNDRATRYLQNYLDIYPDAALIRLQVAELCFRRAALEESRKHFRRALGEVTDPPLPVHCRLHAHSRLMEIAAEQGKRFDEELQRGMGLTVLAENRQQESPDKPGTSAQELYGKARLALERAALLSPGDAQPPLYLVTVWQGMQQTRNAHLAFDQARRLALGSSLSPYDQLKLAQLGLELTPVQHTSLKR